MDHLWLLTEERPKPSVVLQIIKMYCKDIPVRFPPIDVIILFTQKRRSDWTNHFSFLNTKIY